MEIEQAPKASQCNRKSVEAAKLVGCFYCVDVYPATEIIEYVDEGNTALCQRCGVDALLPGVTDKEFLMRACDRWFTGPRPPTAAEQAALHRALRDSVEVTGTHTHTVSVETIAHYRCGYCGRWWSIADDGVLEHAACPSCTRAAYVRRADGGEDG